MGDECRLVVAKIPLYIAQWERMFLFGEVEMMIVNKAFKFRIYPNKKQEVLIAKTIGCSRFVFNHFLAKWNDTYKETGKGLTYNFCYSKLPSLKEEYEWLKEVDSIAIQSSLKNLADSYSRFFKKRKIKHHDSSPKGIRFNHTQ